MKEMNAIQMSSLILEKFEVCEEILEEPTGATMRRKKFAYVYVYSTDKVSCSHLEHLNN